MERILRLLLCLALASTAFARETDRNVLFREDFNTLGDWKPFTFPKIKTHSTYTIEREGGQSYLRAESKASASAIVYKEEFDVYEYPKVRWRWKVQNIYQKADATTKEGDDFPIRIYIMFVYDPDKAGFGEGVKYGFAKALYGEYPPHSSLNYVWSGTAQPERIITNPYTDRARSIVLRSGAALAGTWQDEEADILADYRAAFGADPPARARIAIMNDSDDTGESSASWVDHIEVFAAGAAEGRSAR